MPEISRENLVELLVTVSRAPAGALPKLDPEERKGIQAYLDERLRDSALSPREKAFCTGIAQRLRDVEATSLIPERRNVVLRRGIDKCEAHDFDAVNPHELSLMRVTHDQLRAIQEPTPGHTRLRAKVARALAAYDATCPTESTATCTAIDAPPGGVSREPEDLFAACERSRIADLAGYPVNFVLRSIEHLGNLTIVGDIPEDGLLIVNGGATIKGDVGGHIHATGSIWIDGDVLGGYIVSDHGDIFCGRAGSGVHLVAPGGSIRAERVEHCAVVFAGKELRIEGDIAGNTAWASTITLGGTLGVSESNCLGGIWAERVEIAASHPPRIRFRSALSTEETGRALAEHALDELKENIRIRMRKAVSGTMLERCIDDQYAVWKLMIYVAKSGGECSPTAAELRELQARALFFAVLGTAGSTFANALAIIEEVGGSSAKALAVAAQDETQQAVGFLEREVGRLSPQLASVAKDAVQTACRHLHSLARKVKEAAVNDAPLGAIRVELEERTRAWMASQSKAQANLSELKVAIDSHLGDKLADPSLPRATLEAMATALAREALPPPEARIIKFLEGATEYYSRTIPDWLEGIAGTDELLDEKAIVLRERGTVVLAALPPVDYFIQAESLPRGLEIQSPASLIADFHVDRALDTATRIQSGPDGVEIVAPN